MLIHGLGLRILVNGLHTGVHASSKGEGYLESSIGFRAHGNVAISLQSAYIHTDTHRNSVLNTEKCVKITLKRPTSSDVGSGCFFFWKGILLWCPCSTAPNYNAMAFLSNSIVFRAQSMYYSLSLCLIL